MDTRTCNTCSETKPLNDDYFGKSWNYKYKRRKGARKYTESKPRINQPCNPSNVEGEKRFWFRHQCHICFAKANAKRAKAWRDINGDYNRARKNEHYEQNKERLLKGFRDRRIKLKDQGIEYLGGKCADCGGVFPREAFDFHHLDPKQKEFQLSDLLVGKWENAKKELDKCVLLCANDHRIRHAKLRQENSL